MKRLHFIGLGVLAVLVLGVVGCVNVVLPAVPNRVDGAEAIPPVLAPYGGDEAVTSVAGWEARKPLLRAAFETHVFGEMPAPAAARVTRRRVVDDAAFDGAGRIEELTLDVAGFDRDMYLVLVVPNAAAGPVPVIVTQHFCGNRAALGGREDVSAPGPGACADEGVMGWGVKQVFGRWIMEPPIERILDRGYALAVHYPGDLVPDAAGAGETVLDAWHDGDDAGARTGAIAAWAWAYSRVVDVLDEDPRFDRDRVTVWGHSRNGKSALVAAAWDDRIDAVIAHQSGTGGATLTRSLNGESVEKITEAYPHWFAPRYAAYGDNEAAVPIEQHQLLALIAPRPVLLGNAVRDKWSDPEGAFLAAEGADPVFELYGSDGLVQETMKAFDPSADLAFFLRPGRHGVRTQDWDMFLDFLDAHFGGPRVASANG